MFQKPDLARAALKDGLILSWDTGLGKTWAMFLWALLKVGFTHIQSAVFSGGEIKPKAPVLIIAPGDLHQQIAVEAATRFHIQLTPLDSQETFHQLTRQPGSILTNLSSDGRPVLAPGFYITSYTELTTNGVAKLPDAYDWEPRALLEWLCLSIGYHQEPELLASAKEAEAHSFKDVCELFAWRGVIYRDHYDILNVTDEARLSTIEESYNSAVSDLARWIDPRAASSQRKKLDAAWSVLSNLACERPCPKFIHLSFRQQDYIIREFCARKLEEFSQASGETKDYPIGEPPPGYNPLLPETDTRLKRRIKCVYSPSLADLAYRAFDCVVIDEGVKMKGEDTYVGRGVRSMDPRFRLVLTATPIKNRLPDIFRLAWWATGGRAEGHARFPYRDDPAERAQFAETFVVTERNLTREGKAKAEGKKATSSRFKKVTAEVCNIHRLWKLFGPIILRRRKEDTGIEIVPRVRKVVRCQMGSLQKRVYQYHLEAEYIDRNGMKAVGAQLQALRIAAADPSSDHLEPQPGGARAQCECHGARPLDLGVCPKCHGKGEVILPHRSGTAYTPKTATVLTIIAEILERKEQVVVGSAFNDPLDFISDRLREAGVRHITLDGRVSQQRRGLQAAIFKLGRFGVPALAGSAPSPIPVMGAGVECMAEGHSFHLANNVIYFAYSWAADKFKQFLDRVHRLNSVKPINVYVVLCDGSIDRKLESLTNEKTDAAELVLDGRLIGERTEEVNLAELLRIARQEFNAKDNTIDEAVLQSEWPTLRSRLSAAMAAWDLGAPAIQTPRVLTPAPAPTPATATESPVEETDWLDAFHLGITHG